MLDHDNGFLRVLGGPGTGKSTLLAEFAADRIQRLGLSPDNVLVLTASKHGTEWMRREITGRLVDDGGLRAGVGPLVRTVHSYAFAVLRLQAARADRQSPRLLNGPEQDAIVRELLEGDYEDGALNWPESLRAALPVPGFAQEVRDLLLRVAEQGLTAHDLIDLGHRHDRPEWVAAGTFGRQYEQVTLLRNISGQSAPELDAAELVSSAVHAFDSDPALLDAERDRVRCLLVDDAQHLDPQQDELIRRLGATTPVFVMAGDPDQAVFSFRGADPRCLADADPGGDRTEVLTVDHRMSQHIRGAVLRLANRLPGKQRELFGTQEQGTQPQGTQEQGALRVRLLATEAQEAAWVADQLRRAHLLDGVAFSEMAVVVRSVRMTLPVLRRALLAAGVPLATRADDTPLAQRPAVRPLLTLLRCAARSEEWDAEAAETLLMSSLGGADPLALRRLRRGLRRLDSAAGGERSSDELLVRVLLDADQLAALEDVAAEPARRVSALLHVAMTSIDAGDSVEETLWKVWRASGLEQQWLARSERGGTAGAQADRDLDAVVALFDAAAGYVDRLPGAHVGGFVADLMSQRIAGSSLAPAAPHGESVTVLTAHSAPGREWDVVAIPGVQEGTWPDLRIRGSLLGVERLMDVLSGVDGPASATAPLLAEERRLLLVAASRARRTLLVSAVRGEDEQPSRFLDELEPMGSEEDARPLVRPERGLRLADLVGELRQVVCDPEQKPQRRERAAGQLARLADAGVPGASPDSWYGLPESSAFASLLDEGDPVAVSPSTVEVLAKCPLRWMIERHGGQDEAELASITGTLVHALIEKAAEGADADELNKELDTAWEKVDAGAPWFSRRERERVERMLRAFLAWLESSRDELTSVANEKDLDVSVPGQDGGPSLRLRGRVDRLETDGQGRPVVVDVKTGKTPVSKNDAEEHPQLAVYQLAAALGAFHGGESTEPGGARLLYVAKPEAKSGAATQRQQQGLDSERLRVWLDVVHTAAASSLGPAYVANENPDCPRCPARASCPVHPAGRQVGQ